MAKLTQTIQLMDRIDKLIKRRATGTPLELADRLNISKASLHRLLDVMKEFGAPIEYCITNQSYKYTREVEFFCGFYADNINQQELQKTNGGFQQLEFLSQNNIYSGSVSKNEPGMY